MNPPDDSGSPRLQLADGLPSIDSLGRALRAAEPRGSSDALSKAQALLDSHAVYDVDDSLVKVAAAFQALAISPLCANAYLELAYMLRLVVDEKKQLLRMAMEAAEKDLGPEIFAEQRGEFWGLIETRPYMRARAQLADMAKDEDDWRHAADEYAELIELNNNDNLGCRYSLMACLLYLGDRDALYKLFERFEGEGSTHMLYTQALAAFLDEGPNSMAAAKIARAAMKHNKHVPKLLSVFDGYKYELDLYAVGKETEAMAYSDLFGELWDDTPGAVPWLLKLSRAKKKSR